MEKSKRKRIVLYLVLIGGLALLVCYFDEITGIFRTGRRRLPAAGSGLRHRLCAEHHHVCHGKTLFYKKRRPLGGKNQAAGLPGSIHFCCTGDYFSSDPCRGSGVIERGTASRGRNPGLCGKGDRMGRRPQRRDSGSERLAGKSCHRLAEDHPSVPGKSDGDPELYSGACRPFNAAVSSACS